MAMLDRTYGSLTDGRQYLLQPDTRLLQTALALIADTGQLGGMQGFADAFRQAGLGHIVDSWIAPGENLPVSTAQLEMVLDDGHLRQISEETGLPRDETVEALGEMLPRLVDRVTPDGAVPPGGLGDVAALLAEYMRPA
ncbi:protein of unknown function [Noviherbaspirillum humi]|uniref:DUF937 domain-containing protein n=1 Tax=Noviherbaspirillum humi TaxID=1688639 RepID=A0A239GNE9_9BURK|nr:YidB family protein [Noviherbaspirillum humi]SNS69594.1 protein of unknown function [Noviherbaspirillum humi]